MTGTHGSSVKWMFLLFLQFGQRMWCRGFRPTVMFTAFGAQPFDALRAVENRRIRIDAFVATDAVSGAANCSEIEALVFRKMTQEFVVVSLGFAWRGPPKNGKNWNSRFPEWLTFRKTSITLNTHPGFPPWSGNHRADIRGLSSLESVCRMACKHRPHARCKQSSTFTSRRLPVKWAMSLKGTSQGARWRWDFASWRMDSNPHQWLKNQGKVEPRKIVPSTYF